MQEIQRSVETHPPDIMHWVPPQEGLIKVNCDVATKKGSPRAAIAAMARDHRGMIVDGHAAIVSIPSAFQGEALGIRLAGSDSPSQPIHKCHC
ncbi:hypothetical protein RHMOL_Rhmol06G0009900 [Rhododendron molle]|uniref:Uncharacterized protein n=1 Tax=Rhododendron molle TaxID=49168 RepID=A0ACC0N8P4_RHOML|nr:hypothetical protein RHMOL_Rhmol06G0009900 [Rhododendron molle]